MEPETTRRSVIYGTNFLTPSGVNLLKRFIEFPRILNRNLNKVSNAANPYGAVFFGALDIAGRLSEKIKNSKYTRLPHLAGAFFYSGATLLDGLSAAGGDYNALYNLAFDASMAYQLGKDSVEDHRNRSLKSDFKEVVDDVKEVAGNVRSLVGRLG